MLWVYYILNVFLNFLILISNTINIDKYNLHKRSLESSIIEVYKGP